MKRWQALLAVALVVQLNWANAETPVQPVSRETVKALIQRFEFNGQLQQMLAAIVQQTQSTLPQVADEWIDQRPYWDFDKRQHSKQQLAKQQDKLLQAFADEIKQLDLTVLMEDNLLAVSGQYFQESDLQTLLQSPVGSETSSTPLPAMLTEAMQRTMKQMMPLIGAARDRAIEKQFN
ncbi:hypothetical protein HNQ59_000160 [Chitinivorax tropicus]|uniref:DUF2059 domain-containing protein n=1 Tax=Chitinivorax tropicus TaxID=714531 RepID=A0A840MDZ2_9PROT|nr:hypothetical protein [Chitinivorax tropicus]MBB5016898.1 hypothetical protein [Chitinivorax tropicus]